MGFYVLTKNLRKVGEKRSIMSLSMKDREISPSGSEFNQGLGKPRPWLKIPTPRVRYLYPTWTLMVDCYILHKTHDGKAHASSRHIILRSGVISLYE